MKTISSGMWLNLRIGPWHISISQFWPHRIRVHLNPFQIVHKNGARALSGRRPWRPWIEVFIFAGKVRDRKDYGP